MGAEATLELGQGIFVLHARRSSHAQQCAAADGRGTPSLFQAASSGAADLVSLAVAIMHIYDLRDVNGEVHAFEVSNTFLTRSQACRIVESITGASLIKQSKLFRDSDVFCEFRIGDEIFLIEEPFGDNSRYWVGPRESIQSSALGSVRAAFANYSLWRSPISALLLSFLVLLAVLMLINILRFIEQDKCLDSAGHWQKRVGSCTHSTN